MTSLHVSRNWLVPFAALDAASPRGPAAPYWLDLDREAYAAQLAELKQWVDTVLRPNYGGYELRDCWPSHIHVIWELSTLAAEWFRTYSGKLPALPRALEFYGRWLPGTTRRVSEYTGTCIGQCSVSRRLPYDRTGRSRRSRTATKATSPGVRRTLASSRWRSRRLATLLTPSSSGRLSLYRSAMRSRSTSRSLSPTRRYCLPRRELISPRC